MGKIRIGYVIDRLAPGGGTENQLIKLLENIDRENFEPIIFSLRPRDPQCLELGCETYYLDIRSLMSLSTVKAVFKAARLFRRKNIHILQIYFYDGRLVGTMAGRLAGVNPIVYCRREMGWWYTPMKLRLSRFLARLSHHCLVNAEAVKKMVAATEGFPSEKITVIPNGVDLEPGSPDKRPRKSDFGIPEDAPVIGVVSNLREVKRLDRFLELAARIENKKTHFLIIGKGPLQDKLAARAAELGLADRVHFHHAVKGVHDIIALFDIGVLSSESEGLSNVLIEYSLSGIPSLAFDVGGNPEIILNGETGYIIADGDIGLMAEKANAILSHLELKKKLGETAASHARENFSIKKMTLLTEELYRRLAGKRINSGGETRDGGQSVSSPERGGLSVKKAVKLFLYSIIYILVLPSGLLSQIFRKLLGTGMIFEFFSQSYSLIPGVFGIPIRACFYKQTLKKCSLNLETLFGCRITKMECELGDRVAIGAFTSVGLAEIGDKTVISSYVSVLSGRRQHDFKVSDKSVLDGPEYYSMQKIGKNCFIGEHSVIMADIGNYAVLGAGSVVVKSIPDFAIAVGNPAKVIKLREGAEAVTKITP